METVAEINSLISTVVLPWVIGPIGPIVPRQKQN